MTAARPLLVIPPLSRSLAGPPAAVGALAGAVPELKVLDLNGLWLRAHLGVPGGARNPAVVGDHAKFEGALRQAAAAWEEPAWRALRDGHNGHLSEFCARHLWVDHAAIEMAVHALYDGAAGRFVNESLPRERPSLVAVSIMFADQVLGALLVIQAARRRWPGVQVVAGGAHVTALGEQVCADARLTSWADVWVRGYAESTFRELCLAAGRGEAPARGASQILDGQEQAIPWSFPNLTLYGVPTLTLPIQASRGCAYGRCAFCTYPAVEGQARRMSLGAMVEPVVELAVQNNADLALRDALASTKTLDEVAALVDGRARFSACTRLRPRLGAARLERWARGGLRTLEVGVESIDDATLRVIDKRQRRADVEALLADAAGLPIHIVLNVMYGWPGQTAEQALAELAWAERELPARFPRTLFSTERNLLQVERRSPMGRDPGRYGIRVLGAFPWATALCWDEPPWRAELEHRFTGHHEREVQA